MKISACGLTDIGKVRTNNEDSFLCDEKLGLFIVADGMGGHNAGEVASKQAIDIVYQNIRKISDGSKKIIYGEVNKNLGQWSNYLASSIRLANTVIFQAAQSSPEKKGMGTTIAAIYYDTKKNVLSCAYVGDSRIYAFNDGKLQLLTEDHTLVTEQLKLGMITPEEAKVSHYQHILSRALGVSETVDVDITEWPAIPDSHIIICTDGLTRMVSDTEISNILTEMSRIKDNPCQAIAQKLIDTANENGGRDNITVVVLKFTRESIFSIFKIIFYFIQ